MMPYQQRRSLGAIETEGLIGRQVAAGADPDLEPTATHQIEYRGVLSHSDRQLERQRHDPGPQADARRPGSDLGEKHKRRLRPRENGAAPPMRSQSRSVPHA